MLESEHYYLDRENSMEVNIFSNSNSDKKYLIDFLLKSKEINFIFHKIKKMHDFKDSKVLFVVAKNTDTKDFISFHNDTLKYFINIFYLLPAKLFEKTNPILEHKVFYPLSYKIFNNILLSFFDQKFLLYNKIILSNDNLLVNLTNQKKFYLTEIESKMMKLLINNKFVSRELINEKVLGLKKNIDSKSFDAHLYRLRIKLSHVSDEIIIKSNNIHKIELIKLID